MTKEELKQLIAKEHNIEFSKKPGMVYQVWEDGEVTLQKSGELLWQRSLHCILPGFNHSVDLDVMPVMDSGDKHSYAFVRDNGSAMFVRVNIELFLRQSQ